TPIPWQAEPVPHAEGGTRVHIRPPPTADSGGALALILSATAPVPTGTGTFTLPRVCPVGVPATDELWGTREEPGTTDQPLTIRPVSARGLAWIDPSLVPPDATRLVADAADSPGHLAWRWTSAQGRDTQGFPAGGAAWEIELPSIRRGRVILLGRLERPWGGQGPIPLIGLAARFRARGTTLILVDHASRSVAQASGLDALEPTL